MTARSAVYSVDSLGAFDIDDQLSDLGWRVRGEFGEWSILPERREDVVFKGGGATTAMDRAIWFYRHDMRCERMSGSVAVPRRGTKHEGVGASVGECRAGRDRRMADGGWRIAVGWCRKREKKREREDQMEKSGEGEGVYEKLGRGMKPPKML